jgi:hypothetical protein
MKSYVMILNKIVNKKKLKIKNSPKIKYILEKMYLFQQLQI